MFNFHIFFKNIAGTDYYENTTYELVQVTTLNGSTYSIPPPTVMIFMVIFIAVVALLFIVTVVACIICGILRMSSRRIKVKTTNQSWIYTTDTAVSYTKVDANDSHRRTNGTRRKQRVSVGKSPKFQTRSQNGKSRNSRINNVKRNKHIKTKTNHVKVNSETYPHESEVLDVEQPPEIPPRNLSDSHRGTNGTRREQRVSVGKSPKFLTRSQNGKSRNSRIDNVKRNKHIKTKTNHVKVNSETYPHEYKVLEVELPPEIPPRDWSESHRGTNGTRRKQRVSDGKSPKFLTRRQNGKSRNSRIDNVKRNKHIKTKTNHVKVNSETYTLEYEVLDAELPPEIPPRNRSDTLFTL
ncbi:uncharacterized protein LOC144451595 [Glandiceps talaboti]